MIFLPIILITGVLTTFTDLKSQKIYNRHLMIGAVLGFAAAVLSIVFRHENILPHIGNGLAAFLIGIILHRSALWAGGDAKLFALYAFLMPAQPSGQVPLPNAVSLFACSFITGTAILLPFVIKDILSKRKAIIDDLFSQAKRQAIFRGIGKAFVYSWALFPIFYLIRHVEIPLVSRYIQEHSSPTIILLLIFLIFSVGYKVKKEIKERFMARFLQRNYLELLLCFLAGYFMRLWLAPESLSSVALPRYFIIMGLSTVLSVVVYSTFNHFQDYKKRVPFAPLLLTGCVLSYTPFLTILMRTAAQWNVLLSR